MPYLQYHIFENQPLLFHMRYFITFTIATLNNLAPDIVEAIVEGNEPDGLSIEKISRNIPEDWAEQRKLFGFPAL